LYLLETSPRQLVKISREDAILSLTDGIIAVTDNTRFVFVEAPLDQLFYKSAYDGLKRSGKSSQKPNLVFMKAGSDKGDEGGGKDQVIRWVSSLRDNGATNFFGIVDNDGDTQEHAGTFKIARHCIENYLADPLLIAGKLVRDSFADKVLGWSPPRSEASALLSVPPAQLQQIADKIVEVVLENYRPTGDSEKEVVTYVGGVSIKLPRWYLYNDGKMIYSALRNGLNSRVGTKVLTNRDKHALSNLLGQTLYEFVPADIVNMLKSIRSA
jgi:hypothetical protein